jgi:hypothetical protein
VNYAVYVNPAIKKAEKKTIRDNNQNIMNKLKVFSSIIICFLLLSSSGKKEKIIIVKPTKYAHAFLAHPKNV